MKMPAGWVVPLGVSLLLHGVFLAGLAFLPAGREADPHQVTDTTVREDFSLSLVRVERLRPGPPHPPGPEIVAEMIAPTPPATEPVVAASHVREGSGVVGASGSVPGGTGVALASGNADGGGGGSRIFPVPATAASVVFVLDRSISMGPSGALAAARRELLACLLALPPSLRFQVIPYNRQAEPLRIAGRRELIPATPDTIQQAIRQVRELCPEGATDHVNALRRGLSLRPALLWLITDADDLTLPEVRRITDFNQGRTVLHVIELSGARGGRYDHPLERLARANAGTYRRVNPDRLVENAGRDAAFVQPAAR
jgi:hypothetical protein